jgi:hypothetical protein
VRSIAALGLFLVSCGSNCADSGCVSSLRLTATLERAPTPWSITFCRGGDCSTCRLGDHDDSSANCSGVVVSLSSSDASETVRLVVSSSKPPFDDGEALSLLVSSGSGDTLLDWKGTAKYDRITTGGPDCANPGHCASFSRAVP